MARSTAGKCIAMSKELAQISRRYRDNGHPKFWGRIIGASSDHETNEWLAGKFQNAGADGCPHSAAGSGAAMDAKRLDRNDDGWRQVDHT